MESKRVQASLLAVTFTLGINLFVTAPASYSQVISGAITGIVTDTSSASVADAEVTATNSLTKLSRTFTTSSSGDYSIEGLPPGTYDISVRKTGFKTSIVEGIKLELGARVGQNIALEVGSVATAVNVIASAVAVETKTGESGGSLGSTEIHNLALNGRNFMSLGMLIPGVNSAGTSSGGILGAGKSLEGGAFAETTLVINGLGREATGYLVDGVRGNETGAQISLHVTPQIDSIEEFRVLKDNFSAKYGQGGGAQVMVETKSGTQVFHGTAYEYNRNNAFNAAAFFAPINPVTGKKRKDALKRNIFGGSFGGPFYIPGKYNSDKTKTFFFVSEDFRVTNKDLVLRGAMIPQALRTGDFTSSPTLGTGGLKLDAASQSILATSHPGVNCVPDSTHLNAACFDSNAVLLMNTYWPLPNNPSGGFLNFINPGLDKLKFRTDSYRVDQKLSEKLNLMARFSYQHNPDDLPADTWGANPAPVLTQSILWNGWDDLVRLTANISPTMVNSTSFSVSISKVGFLVHGPVHRPAGLVTNFPYKNADIYNNSPAIDMGRGWSGQGDGLLPWSANDAVYVLNDDLTKVVKGSHTLSVGGLVMWGVKRQNTFSQTRGEYFFSGVHANDPVADYLLGLDSSFFQYSAQPRLHERYNQYEVYVQDDWRFSRKLTMNLGVRYSYFPPDIVPEDSIGDFDPGKWDPAKAPAVQNNGLLVVNASGVPITKTGAPADLLNGVVIAGRNGVPPGVFVTPKTNFAPRLGFAWDVFGDGKTSLRGGYGLSYFWPHTGIQGGKNRPPFVSNITLLNGTLTDPTLGNPAALGTQGLTYVGPPGGNRDVTKIHSWSLTFEHELVPNGVLSLAYVGSRTTSLFPEFTDTNFPLPVASPSLPGTTCLQAGQTIPSGGFDFDPCINAGLVSADITRPKQGWSSISNFWGADDYHGVSNYHSLQSGFHYRAGHGLTLTTAYTWGKTLSDVANRGADTRNYSASGQNQRNFPAEYGRPSFDRTHIFAAGYIYDLPILRNRNDALGKAFGDWTFSGLTVMESGYVFSPSMGLATSGLARRPNCVGNTSGPKTVAQWFNTAAFAAPAFGFFGNCGNGIIQGPSESNWNLAFFKTFPIGEKYRLQFRGEFFNAWNHPNFTTLSTSLGAGNFGAVTGTLDSRQIELALRLDF